ncbi:MAG TPA: hypothetical protein V6C78_28200 [Crinalium sp.]
MASRRAKQRQLKRRPDRAIAFELSTKVVINALLIIASASTLIKLVPYHRVQQAKLNGIRSEVAQIEKRVDQLRVDFSNQFDPQQTMENMQEHSGRIYPNQRRIVWMNSGDAAGASSQNP